MAVSPPAVRYRRLKPYQILKSNSKNKKTQRGAFYFQEIQISHKSLIILKFLGMMPFSYVGKTENLKSEMSFLWAGK